MYKSISPVAALVALGAFAPVAAQEDVIFNATVAGSCTIVVDTSGTLGVATDFTQLSSALAGGTAAGATVTASDNSFSLTLAAATAFDTGPSNANTNTTFAAAYDASGATSATDVAAATPTALTSGITNVSVDASADKTTGIFDAGSYSLTTTLTCAP